MVLKKIFPAIILLFVLHVKSSAQLNAEQRIQDSVIGWWSNNQYDHLKPQTDPVAKKKEANLNKMVDWLKKSYIPVGGLGTTSRYINQYSYGVNGLVWDVSHEKMWTDAKGNFRPISEQNTKFYLFTNRIYGSSDSKFLSSADEWYLTVEPDGFAESDQVVKFRNSADPRIHPNAYKYLTWINEMHTVYLAPGNKLPLIPVTRGELLDRAEASINDRFLAEKRKEKEASWPGNTKAIEEAMDYEKNVAEKYRNNIRTLREKYKNTLQEPAYVNDGQLTLYSFQADPDIFKVQELERRLKHYYPVYKIDKATIQKLQGDQPLWIAVSFPYETKERGNQLYEMYTALSQNINYDYIYNYFYDPEKIKGIAYTPANEAQLNARLDAYRKKNNANINAVADTKGWAANTHFQDNFENNELNSEPKNWYFNKFDEHDAVVELKNQPGKWLRLGYNNYTIPSLLKKPLPKNFTAEFDLVTEDFSGRYGGGVEFYLSTNPQTETGGEKTITPNARITIRLQAGNSNDFNNNNYSGEAKIELRKTPEVNEQNFSGGAFFKKEFREFNNKNNKVHIAFTVKEGVFQLFVNGKRFADASDFKLSYGSNCTDCNISTALNINRVTFRSIESSTHAYISNFKIIKE